MQKKLLAVAMAGALGAPAMALAQSSTVQVFGTLYVEYGRQNQADAAPGVGRTKADYLQAPGNNIGFKGEEKLGGGLSAWFQCESTADIRGEAAANSWCQRNSALGFKGGFGNVFVGVWDTPFKRAVSPATVGGNDTGFWGTGSILLGDSTTETSGTGRLDFKRRQRSTINYDSPNFGGFQVMTTFSSSQAATGTLSAASNNKPRVLSLAGQYSAGPIFLSAGYEQHKEFGLAGGIGTTAANTPANTKDNAWFIGGAYTWGPVRVGGLYTRQKFDAVIPTGDGDVRLSTYHVGVDWTVVGPHGLRASYSAARDVKGPTGPVVAGILTGPLSTGGALALGAASGTNYRPAPGADTGAKLMQIRYVYTFSKRTEFTAGYVRLNNDNNAGYRIMGAGAAIKPGDNEDAWAVAVRHTF